MGDQKTLLQTVDLNVSIGDVGCNNLDWSVKTTRSGEFWGITGLARPPFSIP